MLSFLTIDPLTHCQWVFNVLKHLLLSMGVLPLFNAMVLSMDLLKVRVHFLVFSERHCLLIFNLLGPVLLCDFVLQWDLSCNLSGTLLATIIAIHESDKATWVRSDHFGAGWVLDPLLLGLYRGWKHTLMALDEHIDSLVLLSHLGLMLRGVLTLHKWAHHASAGVWVLCRRWCLLHLELEGLLWQKLELVESIVAQGLSAGLIDGLPLTD